MVKRVVIQGGGASPIRMSVAGVNVDGAQFNDLLFDGNQHPLRIHGTGYVEVPVINRDVDSVKSIEHVVSNASLPVVPAGTTPLFLVAIRNRTTEDSGKLQTPFALLGSVANNLYRGGGGAISNVDGAGLRFVGLTFAIRLSTVPNDQPPTLVNYCIFRNAQ